MNTKRKPYKTYTREFKLEVVRLMAEANRAPAEVAMELGIRRNQLYKWKEQFARKGEETFSGRRGRPSKEDQSEVTTLKQENARLKEENAILKKAAAYFARDLK
jgi:transposase